MSLDIQAIATLARASENEVLSVHTMLQEGNMAAICDRSDDEMENFIRIGFMIVAIHYAHTEMSFAMRRLAEMITLIRTNERFANAFVIAVNKTIGLIMPALFGTVTSLSPKTCAAIRSAIFGIIRDCMPPGTDVSALEDTPDALDRKQQP